MAKAMKLFALRDSSGALISIRTSDPQALYFSTRRAAKESRKQMGTDTRPLFVTYGPDHRKYGGTK